MQDLYTTILYFILIALTSWYSYPKALLKFATIGQVHLFRQYSIISKKSLLLI